MGTQFTSIWPIDRTLSGAITPIQSTWKRWQWRGTPYSPKHQHYCSLTIGLFSVNSRTLIGGVLLLSRDAVGVFYCPSRLGKYLLAGHIRYLLPGYILYLLPGYILYLLPGYILYLLPGYILYLLPGYILYLLPGYILYLLPGYILYLLPGYILYLLPGYILYLLPGYIRII